MIKSDLPSELFSRLAHRVHPRLGHLYDTHIRFFNDGIVELICLMIANGFIWGFSYYFVGLGLALILTMTSTPITYCLKYLMHKYWVWRTEP